MPRLSPYLRELRPTFTLATPIIVGQVSQMLMGVMDSAMIGHAGTVPLAASAFAANVFNIFYVVGIGLMIPVSILVSRARGAQKPEEAGEHLRHGIALALVFGLGETLLMFALGTQLHRFNQPPEVVAIVTPFYLLFAASFTPVLIYLALRQFAEAMGHPWAPMFIMLAGVALNALLNWIFIFGHLGAPALGLTGAGISTLISRTIGAAVIFAWLRRDPRVRDAWPSSALASQGRPARGSGGRRGIRSFTGGWVGGYSRKHFGEFLHLGLPAAGMLLFEVTAFAFSGIMMGWLGAVPLAAHQISISCASMAFMLPLGLSMAVGIRVSHVVGSGQRERLRPIAFSALGLGLVVMATFALIFAAGGRTIASWFVHDLAVVVLAAQLLLVAAVFQMADGVQVIAAHLLRGISDVKVPTAITLIAYWGIALPLAYLIGVRGSFGAIGIWTGIASGLGFAAVFLTVRFARLTR
jgi:MATE family multidrug resistance protein